MSSARIRSGRSSGEGTSIILEGIHLFPGLVDFGAASGSVSVHLILSLDDRDALVQRLERRGDESARPAERYDAGLGRSAILIVEAVESVRPSSWARRHDAAGARACERASGGRLLRPIRLGHAA